MMIPDFFLLTNQLHIHLSRIQQQQQQRRQFKHVPHRNSQRINILPVLVHQIIIHKIIILNMLVR
jgi:hypothetical protein